MFIILDNPVLPYIMHEIAQNDMAEAAENGMARNNLNRRLTSLQAGERAIAVFKKA